MVRQITKSCFFSKPEFNSWATKNVILVELDFPRRTKLPAKVEKQNRELAQLFGVRGYPTVWFVTAQQENGKINFNKLRFTRSGPVRCQRLDYRCYSNINKQII